MENIATTSSQIIQNSVLTEGFLITGQVVWAGVFLVGLIVILKTAWNNIKPKKK